MSAEGGFVVINGQRFSIDQSYKASKHYVEQDEDNDDEGEDPLFQQESIDAQQQRERAEYLSYLRGQHEAHVSQMHQNDDDDEEDEEENDNVREGHRGKRSRRHHPDDDVDNEAFMKRCRSAAADIASEMTSPSTSTGTSRKPDEFTLPASEFGLDAEWYVEVESTVEKEKDYIPIMDPEQRDIDSLLEPGEDRTPKSCFACKYMCDPRYNTMYIEPWTKVVKMWERERAVHINYAALGHDLYKVFMNVVVPVLVKQGRSQEGESVWSPYGILYHFMEHCDDPIMRSISNLRSVDRDIRHIRTTELYMRHPASTRKILSMNGLRKMKLAYEIRQLAAKPLASVLPNEKATATEALTAAKRQHYSTKDLVRRPNFKTLHNGYT